MNMVGPRAISRGHLAFVHQVDNLLAIRFGQLEAAAELAPGFARLGQSGPGALADETEITCMIMTPAEVVVVSMLSVNERKPAPHLSIRSMMLSRLRSKRARRSSFTITTTSPVCFGIAKPSLCYQQNKL